MDQTAVRSTVLIQEIVKYLLCSMILPVYIYKSGRVNGQVLEERKMTREDRVIVDEVEQVSLKRRCAANLFSNFSGCENFTERKKEKS